MKLQDKVDKIIQDANPNLFYYCSWKGNYLSLNSVIKKDEILKILTKEFPKAFYDEENRLIHLPIENYTFPAPPLLPKDKELETVEPELKEPNQITAKLDDE